MPRGTNSSSAVFCSLGAGGLGNLRQRFSADWYLIPDGSINERLQKALKKEGMRQKEQRLVNRHTQKRPVRRKTQDHRKEQKPIERRRL